MLIMLLAVVLSWQDNSSDELGFKIQKTISGDCVNGFYDVATVGVDITSWADDLGHPGDCYRVDAFNDAGESAWSNMAQIPVPQPPPVQQPPPTCHGKGKRKC